MISLEQIHWQETKTGHHFSFDLNDMEPVCTCGAVYNKGERRKEICHHIPNTIHYRKIYVATSWRNPYYEDFCRLLRLHGHEIFDWRNEATAFHWSDIDEGYKDWDAADFVFNLTSDTESIKKGFIKDLNGLLWCDTCIMLLPCGKSAHLELGFASGAMKETMILTIDPQEPELMYLLADKIENRAIGILRNLCTEIGKQPRDTTAAIKE